MIESPVADLLSQYPAKTIISALRPYLTLRRQKRITQVINSRLSGLQLAMQNTSDIHNALAAVRSCDAMGVLYTHLVEPEGEVKTARSVTQGACDWVSIEQHNCFEVFSARIKAQGLLLAGAIMDGEYTLENLPIDQPICLIFGNEQRGLSKKALDACDFLYRIPMYGMSESFNLSVAAAVSMYAISNRIRNKLASREKQGDLSLAEKEKLYASYYLQSVAPRLAQALLKSASNPS